MNDGPSWAKYMSISGSSEDEHDIITLQYTEDGLLSVDENRQGHAAAFGDDIAIECLATEFKREIYVVSILVLLKFFFVFLNYNKTKVVWYNDRCKRMEQMGWWRKRTVCSSFLTSREVRSLSLHSFYS